MKNFISQFNWKIFLVFFLLIFALSFYSYLVTFGVEDGTTKETSLMKIYEIPFQVLWFPLSFFGDIVGPIYVLLLLIQIVFYAFVLERIIFMFKKKYK